MEHWLRNDAKKVPDAIRRAILENGFIESARNMHEFGTPMEYLFDVYEEFIDISGEWDDYACGPCRGKVLEAWQRLKPYLIELENEKVI